MNPSLRDIVKRELQKLLDINFIYPIFDNEWVSPLIIVPNKNGKWRMCVDYRELNKDMQKDHFPFPFINQVLDTLSGNTYFSFLDGSSGYNQIHITLKDLHFPWGTFSYCFLAFGLCSALATLHQVILGFFFDLVNDSVEIYMDEFTPYRTDFEGALFNLEKTLQRCK